MTAIIIPIKGVNPFTGIISLQELAEQLQEIVDIVHDQPYDCQLTTEPGYTVIPHAFRLNPTNLT